MGEYMRLIAAVMKRGANVSLAPSTPAAEPETPARKTRSLAEEDDAPSTADGMVLDLPAEAATATAEPEPAKESGPAEPDRTPLAELLARGTGTVVVLKGHRTVVTDGHRAAINTTGNPAMATAGTGDVLTGVIASLIGQKLSPLDAAVLGVHAHGSAGDLARATIGPNAIGLLSKDIIERLPHALAQVIAG